MDLPTLIVAMSIPSAFTGFCFWLLERKLEQREKERDKKEGRDELGGLASVFHCVNFDSRLTFLNFRFTNLRS